MPFSIAAILMTLGQAQELATDSTATPARRPMSFSDLQQGLRAASQPTSHDRSSQFTLLLIVGAVIALGVVLQLRQRRKEAGPPSSASRLGRELSRQVSFPFGGRLMLLWVAHTVKMPMATLLLSARVFDDAVETWAHQPTFTPIRHWGRSRLMLLKPHLFG